MTFTIGQNVGPYRILEQLGQGGMATVYKAYHAGLDRYVAVKVLHAAFREDPSFTARFTREARVVAKLEHPNIVPIYDFSEYEGQPYLVMKFIEGETLKARLARGPLSAGEAVRVIEAVGAALSYAHSKGILHRDVKPSNVLLVPDGSIYLADFGLARIAQSGESTLTSDMLLGTPHYISPEQAQGMKNLDAGTDIYSFGVVMYELSVGRVPFNADTPFAIIHDHIFTPLPLPRAINPKVPSGVERVLLKALAKDRKDRYPDVDSLVAAFLGAVREATAAAPAKAPVGASDTGKAATPPPPPATAAAAKPEAGAKKPPLWKRIPKWVWFVPAVLACLCLCLIGFSILARNSEQKNRQATQTALAAVVGAAALPSPAKETQLAAEPTEKAQPATQTDIPPDARDAWRHLEEGIVQLDQGDPQAAGKEFQTALDMMPAERAGVIILAVQKLNSRGQWVMSAKFLQKGLEKNPKDTFLRAASTEVLFHVAEMKENEPILRWFAGTMPDWATPQATLGRWLAAFSAKPQEGEPYIRKALDSARGEEKPLARAILGEYMCRTGNTAEGLVQLKDVMNDSITPPWLRVEIERMIEKWQLK
jgi:tRNA A-37 threonylcarbamoyl transferase component Bud32